MIVEELKSLLNPPRSKYFHMWGMFAGTLLLFSVYFSFVVDIGNPVVSIYLELLMGTIGTITFFDSLIDYKEFKKEE